MYTEEEEKEEEGRRFSSATWIYVGRTGGYMYARFTFPYIFLPVTSRRPPIPIPIITTCGGFFKRWKWGHGWMSERASAPVFPQKMPLPAKSSLFLCQSFCGLQQCLFATIREWYLTHAASYSIISCVKLLCWRFLAVWKSSFFSSTWREVVLQNHQVFCACLKTWALGKRLYDPYDPS